MDINYAVLLPEIFLALVGIMTLFLPMLSRKGAGVRYETGAMIAFPGLSDSDFCWGRSCLRRGFLRDDIGRSFY